MVFSMYILNTMHTTCLIPRPYQEPWYHTFLRPYVLRYATSNYRYLPWLQGFRFHWDIPCLPKSVSRSWENGCAIRFKESIVVSTVIRILTTHQIIMLILVDYKDIVCLVHWNVDRPQLQLVFRMGAEVTANHPQGGVRKVSWVGLFFWTPSGNQTWCAGKWPIDRWFPYHIWLPDGN